MKITYDKTADAMYIYLKKARVSETRPINDRVIIDLDKIGDIIGVELLCASRQVPKKMIDSAIRIDLLPSPISKSKMAKLLA